MKKELVGIFICILLIFTTIPMSTTAKDNSINSYSARSKSRIFIFCDIEISSSGRAFLFPGYIKSNDIGINVSGSSGFCVVGNESHSGTIKIKGVEINNWQLMFIIFYSGFLENFKINLPPKPTPAFWLNGNAVMVIVIYEL